MWTIGGISFCIWPAVTRARNMPVVAGIDVAHRLAGQISQGFGQRGDAALGCLYLDAFERGLARFKASAEVAQQMLLMLRPRC